MVRFLTHTFSHHIARHIDARPHVPTRVRCNIKKHNVSERIGHTQRRTNLNSAAEHVRQIAAAIRRFCGHEPESEAETHKTGCERTKADLGHIRRIETSRQHTKRNTDGDEMSCDGDEPAAAAFPASDTHH